MTKRIKLLSGLLSLAIVFPVFAVHANPLTYSTGSQTAAATTTISYMTPGTATTTLIYDSYAVRPTVADKAALQVQFTASSTASVLTIAYEYSNGDAGLDCLNTPASCDWYQDNTSIVATTSAAVAPVRAPNSYSWTFASSSQGGAPVVTNNNRGLKIFFVQTPARYVRAIFTSTGAGAGIWAQFVPAKQSS